MNVELTTIALATALLVIMSYCYDRRMR